MYPLFESIRIENGLPDNLQYHVARMEKSCLQNFGKHLEFNLQKILVPPSSTGVVKCRLCYNPSEFTIEYTPYQLREIKTLKLVTANNLFYNHKYTDRTAIDNLFQLRQPCDEILIIKNNLITDTSIGNILFFSSEKWFTPETPLLPGTMRQFLLDKGLIHPRKISIEDLNQYQWFKPINAMVGVSLTPQPIHRIVT